ncbi:metallophosphoesterase family protein [Haloglycomyces albus]|uniref:metallophosphoesterase family protein n=1 Tax=Haloglycomyces albus TaxID=526067 RepID=UPI00046CD784|nr:metallophosphoesterase [Haloglycomyces albus]
MKIFDLLPSPNRLRRSRTLRIGVLTIALLAVAFASSALANSALGRVDAQIGPFDTTVSVRPDLDGGTKVGLSPLGNVYFDSHNGPLGVTVGLNTVNPQQAEILVNDPNGLNNVSDDIAGEVKQAVMSAAFTALAASLAVGLVLGGILFRRNSRALVTGLLATALTGASLLNATSSLRPESIAEPGFDGVLVYAPGVVGDVESIPDNYDKQLDNLQKFVTNISGLYSAATRLPSEGIDDDSIRVLHVSDLHLNPLAWELISTIVDQFGIDVVADTGDISDYGSQQEAEFYTEQVTDVDAPYLWVKGNHDSTTTQAIMERYDNVTVLDDDITEVAGLTFAGAADPRFTPDKSAQPSDEYAKQMLLESSQRLRNLIDADGEVDVAMVHEPAMAPPLAGSTPLVLAGHTHRRSVEDLGENTTLMICGSTGAAGLRNWESDEPMNMELDVLYFNPDSQGLRAYDSISVSARDQTDISLNRTVIPDDEQPEGAEPPAEEESSND